MEKLIQRYGKGRLTYGAEFICFKPDAGGYIQLAQCGPGKYDTDEWMEFAEALTAAANATLTPDKRTV